VLEIPGSQGMRTVRLTLRDGQSESAWESDPWALAGRRPQHLVAIVDGGPKVISFVVNGRLCDGGLSRQYGWGRIGSQVGDVNGAGTLRLTPGEGATPGEKGGARLLSLRVYTRALRTSEAVGNWRAGL
jgi:hypothetical protein